MIAVGRFEVGVGCAGDSLNGITIPYSVFGIRVAGVAHNLHLKIKFIVIDYVLQVRYISIV